MTPGRLTFFTAVAVCWTGILVAAESAAKQEPVSYYRQVRPIFQQQCQGCHQPAKPLGGFVMTEYKDLLKKGDKDLPGIFPGQPDKSYLLEQVTPKSGKPAAMPKGRTPLLESQVALIRRWIGEGAKDDTPPNARAIVDAEHPPVYLLPPVISSIQYSPDGSLLAVSGYHEILLYKADGSGLAARLIGLSERVQSLAFSPDGKSLAMAGGSPGRFGELQIWDVDKKKLRLSQSITFDTLYGISWSHDSTKVAFGCADNTVRALDAATGKQVLYQGAHNDWVLGTVFSHDSSYLVSVSRDRSMKLTEVATQRFIDNVTSITPGALKGGLLAVARNPRKNNVMVRNTAVGTDPTEKYYDELVVGGADGIPRLYKMHRTTKRIIGDDANRLREYSPMPGRIFTLAFDRNGQTFAAGSSLDGVGEVRVYRTNEGTAVSNLKPKSGPIYTLAFRPPERPRTVAVWSAGGPALAFRIMSIWPDAREIASAGFDGLVRISDPTTGKLIKEFVGVPLSTAQTKAP